MRYFPDRNIFKKKTLLTTYTHTYTLAQQHTPTAIED